MCKNLFTGRCLFCRSLGRTNTDSIKFAPGTSESSATTSSSSCAVPSQEEFVLPGMVDSASETCTKTSIIEADTGESDVICTRRSPSQNLENSPAQTSAKYVQVATSSHPLTYHTTQDIFGRRDVVTGEEAVLQNRRLLPEYKNELHVIDGEERYFMGIIDFFTRYTLKKKLENAYKRVLYPPLSFSTVPPEVFAERFNAFWVEHTS